MAHPSFNAPKTRLMRVKKLIRNGGQFVYLGENISRSKTDIKIGTRRVHVSARMQNN